MLPGLDIGNNFFPREISIFRSGLKVSEHSMKLSDPKWYLGFIGSFPAHFVSMYLQKDHPRALVMQECPQQLIPLAVISYQTFRFLYICNPNS